VHGIILLSQGFRDLVKDLIHFERLCDEHLETDNIYGIGNSLLNHVLEFFFVFGDHSAFIELEDRSESFEFDGEVAGRAFLHEGIKIMTNLF